MGSSERKCFQSIRVFKMKVSKEQRWIFGGKFAEADQEKASVDLR